MSCLAPKLHQEWNKILLQLLFFKIMFFFISIRTIMFNLENWDTRNILKCLWQSKHCHLWTHTFIIKPQYWPFDHLIFRQSPCTIAKLFPSILFYCLKINKNFYNYNINENLARYEIIIEKQNGGLLVHRTSKKYFGSA